MENIKDKLKTLSDNKKILMKQIIAESGVSQPHFYKVINGERALTADLKTYLSTALNITEDQVAKLIVCQNKTISSLENKKSRYIPVWLSTSIFISLLTVIIVISAIYSYINNSKVIEKILEPIPVPADSSYFIKDVTIPDGTPIKAGTTFVKTWRIKNSGNITWEDRYLQRVTLNSIGLCQSVQKVRINKTVPSASVDISVKFHAPKHPGSCRIDWKMVDEKGKLLFPNLQGLYMIVQIIK
ncbi:NBR1-Ig-like domain-containing protein [Pseudoalteromonas fuliginea]|uniref:Nbr1 FW domain-containing protein n=1 Tax=Pseudoalteromonas fuliginea TaxID=1872678 RepID=A0ABD3Y5E8_9GAMM|nr:NBR1-Ig-like domain-containing protein [Pseudoalteromonas fuliginea]KDC49303.1 hypothetical protein DC53_17500 [Pseudoalteromonas fuliginea]